MNISSDTLAYVNYNDVNGNKRRILNSTRQGGAISDLLLSFYINDVIKEVNRLNIGCGIGYHNFNIIGYADDIFLLAPSATG